MIFNAFHGDTMFGGKDEFQCKIEDICKQREDEWALEVRGRLEFVQDLHAADALYHQTCSVNFRTLKQTPLAFSPPAKKAKTQAGRKSSLSESFLFAAKYLQQNEDEQITVTDLVKKMSEHCGIDDAYGVQHMKNKLQEHFGDKIIISEINGKQNVVTFRNTVRSILHEFYEQINTNRSIDEEKKSIIQKAAKILKSEILSSEMSLKALYPPPDEISAQNNMKYVPESPQTLLQTIFSGKDTRLKIMSIGQSIVQAAAPRMFMLPLQLALGVQLHHNFSSRFLIDTLNSLGFCSSYTEIQKFECCAAAEKGNDIPNFVAESFLQYVADNVDHNSGTLDGNNTFHGMGIMAAVTPGSFGTKPISRIDVTSEQIALLAKINISYYKPSESNRMASSSVLESFCIVKNENTESDFKQIVLRLGGFHTEMSFLGSIGRLMAGSGLHEVLETVYASNAVNHMLSGKAVSRVVRGFMMVENALYILFMKESFRVSLPSAHETDITEVDSSECDEIVEKSVRAIRPICCW
ncbi:unnamed protein product [Mytilus coruscus]|uniref:Uncharacterized protein n=1 Tax=Mytilus coruscus TaxID=42192 RepID=A0A6J8ARS1_MYTCO|nr:unnamed protein product [Mytilus coruscus]